MLDDLTELISTGNFLPRAVLAIELKTNKECDAVELMGEQRKTSSEKLATMSRSKILLALKRGNWTAE